MNPKERARLVDSLGSAIADGELSLGQVPQILRKILKEDAWRDFETQMGKHVTYKHFEDFVTTPPLEGLGTTVETLKDIIANDLALRDTLDQALQRPRGNLTPCTDNRNGFIETISDNKTTPCTDNRNRSDWKIRRLRKNFPELHAQVLRNEKTVNEAAVEAKIYPRQLTINLDNPQSAARTIREKASPEFLAELRRLLNN